MNANDDANDVRLGTVRMLLEHARQLLLDCHPGESLPLDMQQDAVSAASETINKVRRLQSPRLRKLGTVDDVHQEERLSPPLTG